MHGIGESLYTFHWQDYAFFFGCFIVPWIVLRWFGKAPSIAEIRDFANIWNSQGGVIVILTALTVYGLRVSMRFLYHILELAQQMKLDTVDGHVQLMLAFVTSNVFMLFAGALIKTMTGMEGGTPVPPVVQPGTSASSTISTSITAEATPTDKPKGSTP